MSVVRVIAKKTRTHVKKIRKKTRPLLVSLNKSLKKNLKILAKQVKKITIVGALTLHRLAKFTHHHVATRPHQHLSNKYKWYRDWHEWPHSKRVHAIALSMYILFIASLIISSYRLTFASDLNSTWDFSTPSNYTYDNGIELNGSLSRLKAQNYSSDANTSALYHLDESNGTAASDSSSNNNTATTSGSPTFGTGNLNNALSFNGTTQNASAPDSTSLSLSQQNSLEAWTKFNSSFSAGSHDQKQGILDKGAYKLYYDQETGKVTYELANSTATAWSQQAGNDINGSWDLNGKFAVNAQQYVNGKLYVGLGNAVGDAEVWSWDGTSWSQVGGDGKNSSWADQTYENVDTLNFNGNTLYAGLGSSTGDAEVWSCDTSTSCATWTKIGGDGINSGWAVNTYEDVTSMTVMSGTLYVGLGTTANDAEVWRWNGSAWTKIGGDSINSGWTTNYESVYSLTNDGTNVYAGLGLTAGDAEVWKWNGSAWSKIGGDAVNSSWADVTYEEVISMRYFGGNLYAGIGLTAGDAEVWSWNGTTWTKIGGDTLNSSWDSVSYEGVYSLADDGTNLYAGLGSTAGDNEVWKWNGSAWSKIGGDAVNSGFTNTHTIVQSLVYANSTLYAGLQATANNSEVWSFNGTSWTRIGGGGINKSWGYFNLQNVESMTRSGDYLYAGTGYTVAGNALIWRFDGTSWQLVGGQGVNSSWSATTYEDVMSMTSFGGNLYVGLGTTANDAEVWKYNGSTWTQIGGDSLNSGWGAGYEEVYSMAVYGGNLYAGLGNSANDAEVWKWNGTTWTKIGGDSLNSGWTTNFERVSSLAVYGGDLYAGLGASTTDAEVWKWNGSVWSKIGGDGVSSSWNVNYEQVETLSVYNGKLYAGLGNSTADAEVWEYNGTAWSQIGGDGLNSGWADGQYEQVKSIAVYNGKLYVGLGNTAGDGEVWVYENGVWAKSAGGGTNSSWVANTIETVQTLCVFRGKLYAGLGNTANSDAQVWSLGNNGFLQSASTSQDTGWHHIAATYDGTTMKIYIDGALNSSTNTSLSMPDTTQPLLLGSTYGGGSPESGWAQGYFTGSLDEIRISNTARNSFTSKPYVSTAQSITLNTNSLTQGVKSLDSFSASESPNGGTITYRLSDDGGSTWKYWNGSAWATSSSTNESNAASVINTNIPTFPVTFYGLRWQAIFTGSGSQQVTLNSVTVLATSDNIEPSTNASSILAYKTNGGTALNSNDWTNGGSPYFTWTAGSDAESGIYGYCLYLGQDNTADPITTKGLLGTSPTYTGSHCQFLVTSASVDLATSGYLGTAMTTSNTPYYLRIKAIDKAGNVYSTSAAQFQFRFDNTPPTNPGYITAPSGFINTKNATLSWPTVGGQAPADGASGVAGLQYRVNNSLWYGDSHTGAGDINDLLTNDGSYNTTDPPDFGNLTEGINTIYFRTWDQAGNVTTSYITAALKVNTSGAPSEPQNVLVNPSTNTANSFAFSWDAPVTYVGDVSNITYCYTINVLPSESNCTYTSPGIRSLGAGPYATQPGSNTFYVVARDESSNINYSSYATTTFTANTPSPGIPTNTDIVDVSIKATSNWRLALTWEPPANPGAGISNYKVYRSTNLNGSFSFVGSSSSTTYIDAGLSPQTYYYRVRACDSTNNCSADGTTVSMLPTGKFTSPANLTSEPQVSGVTTKRSKITWSTDRTSDSKVAIGTSSGKYSASEVGNSDQVTSHSIDLDNLAAGTTYYFVVKWTDEDGNTGTSQEYSFTTSPAPVVKEINAVKIGLTTTTLQFTSKGANKINVYYGLSESYGGLVTINTSQAESTYNVELSGLSDGSKYFYKLSAFDSEGTEYQGNVLSFTTPARPHISDLRFQPVSGEPTSTQKVTWSTNVPASSTITYGKVNTNGIDVQDSTLATSHEITIRGLEDDSEYFLLAQSRDKDGNLAVSDKQVFKTALDTRPPKVSDINVEPSIRGLGAEARGQVIVSWKTDEPSSSQVAYGEGSNAKVFNSKTTEDTSLTTEHIVVVSDLPTSKVYSLAPVSRDKAGNTGNGEPQSAIIGRGSESVLTIILNTLQKVFGL